MQWGDRWVADTPPVELYHHDHRITASWVCDTCGEPVNETRVESVVAGAHPT
ncbi:hypothetical protein [Modestobacter marinus]|uniref:hypothetical protein n=1 Tax=Modestobacter marinus TaxID=477641 RepID=UPI0021BC2E61|nr:hypothetical protein [Modestobacter marinus]